jgi:hypothetical protein
MARVLGHCAHRSAGTGRGQALVEGTKTLKEFILVRFWKTARS